MVRVGSATFWWLDIRDKSCPFFLKEKMFPLVSEKYTSLETPLMLNTDTNMVYWIEFSTKTIVHIHFLYSEHYIPLHPWYCPKTNLLNVLYISLSLKVMLYRNCLVIHHVFSLIMCSESIVGLLRFPLHYVISYQSKLRHS